MSDVTIQLSDEQNVADSRVEPPGSGLPPWWLVFTRELADLWIGGKALYLILAYSILLGIMTYVLASNSELSLIPPKEMVYETLKVAITVSGFIGLIIGSDSLSGERERATLEALLLTPTSRRQIVLGKFLAGISPWPMAMAITVPYLAVLAQGDEVLGGAVLWGALLGSVMVPAYTGLGMFVSFWCNTNRTSFFVSLGIYTLFLVPAQLPGRAQTGAVGQFLQWVNPMAATSHFLSKHLVNYRPVSEYWPWLESPVVFFVLVSVLLFLYASPGLRLESGKASRFWSYWARRIGLLVIAGLMFSLGTSPAMAFQEEQPLVVGLQISVDLDTTVVKTGDKVEFNTLVTNNATEVSPPLIVAMNVINLDAQGDVVDPEDWSPQRTQYIESLAPGQSANLSWIINTILDGDYMVYMVVIPAPDSQETTSQPVASSGIHLTVTPFTRLNPAGILPYVIGGPIVLLLAIFMIYRLRRQRIDTGALALVGLAAVVLSACAGGAKPAPVTSPVVAETQTMTPEGPPPEVIVYASDLPQSALSEFDFWDDPASPGGKMVGTPNEGGELDPPPENDPHVTFKVPVQGSVPYRCWIHMKVGAPKGESQANVLWVQFSEAVDSSNQEILKPGTGSYLTAQGPAQEGWAWVGCDLADPESSESLIYFRTGGEVTVRLQAGMEGVGFDQFLLSPARFLEKPPSEAVVK